MPITFVPCGDPLTILSGPDAVNFSRAIQNSTLLGFNVWGRTTAPLTSQLCDVWGYPSIAAGQQVRVNPTVAFTPAIVSDSVNDTLAGTGAQKVNLYFLDINGQQCVANYSLNGQTAVTVPNSVSYILNSGQLAPVAVSWIAQAYRIQDCEVVQVGSGLANAGNIYVTTSANTYAAGVPVTTSIVYSFIYAGDNIDANSHYTIPAGWAGCKTQMSYGAASAASNYGRFRLSCTSGGNGIYLGFDFPLASVLNSLSMNVLPVFAPMTDLRAQVQPGVAGEVTSNSLLLMWPLA
jgi:hypothetical protein